MSHSSDDQLFALQECVGSYATGICSNGRQAVMGLLCPKLVAYFFDGQGDLLNSEFRDWKTPAPRMGSDGPYKIYDDGFRVALAAQIQEWQTSIGFEPQTIHIRAFWDAPNHIGIRPLPDHLIDFENGDYLEDDERQELAADRAGWLAEGKVVWWWGKDYWIDKDGEVEST